MPSAGTGVTGSELDALPVLLPSEKQQLLTGILRSVSRSFYLTLRVLPREIREPISLGYLLARAADTLADTALIEDRKRVQLLTTLRAAVLGEGMAPNLRPFLNTGGNSNLAHEYRLLQLVPKLFSMLAAQHDAERDLIKHVVTTLIDGMLHDMRRFPVSDSQHVKALKNAAELEHYCYQVAGCVGEFWTGIAIMRVPVLRTWQASYMNRLGIDFGKALQLTNILRDIPQDLRIGRCYLPLDELRSAGLTPDNLGQADTDHSPAVDQVVRKWLARNLELYENASHYILAIPRHCVRLRLATLWPVLIGLRTLSMLARHTRDMTANHTKIKVSRRWVYFMLFSSLWVAPSNTWCRQWIKHYLKVINRRL